jgi:DNA-binding NarL/FixJ family response regulator
MDRSSLGSDAAGVGTPRVIVADDDALARRSVRGALEGAGMTVIAEAPDGRQAVELALHYRPDLVILDLVMAGMDGVTAMSRIVAAAPDVRCVILSVCSDPEVAVTALRHGASGFLTKHDIDVGELPRILESALRGEVACSRKLLAHVVAELRRSPAGGAGMRPVRSDLSDREWEVLDLIALGRSTAEIAGELYLSTETIRSHVKSLMRKLGVHSRAEAVARAAVLRTPDAHAAPVIRGLAAA